MVDRDRSHGRTEAWRPWSAAGPGPALVWPENVADLARSLAEQARRWALADVGPGRLVPWLAVAFGFGIVLYFTAEQEPVVWAAIALAIIACTGAVLARHRPVAFPLAFALGAGAAGVCRRDGQARGHRPSGAAGGCVERRDRRLCGTARRARALRSHYCGRPSPGRRPHHRETRAHAHLRAPRHGAPGRRLHRAQGALVATAGAAASGWLRLRARFLLPADRRLRFCAWPYPHRRAARAARALAAVRVSARRF